MEMPSRPLLARPKQMNNLAHRAAEVGISLIKRACGSSVERTVDAMLHRWHNRTTPPVSGCEKGMCSATSCATVNTFLPRRADCHAFRCYGQNYVSKMQGQYGDTVLKLT